MTMLPGITPVTPGGRRIRPSARQWWLREPALSIAGFIHSASREPRQRLTIYDSLLLALQELGAPVHPAYGAPLEIALRVMPGGREVRGTCYRPGERPRHLDSHDWLFRPLAPSAKTWQCGCRELFLAVGRPPEPGRYYYRVRIVTEPWGPGFRFPLLLPDESLPLQRRPEGWLRGARRIS